MATTTNYGWTTPDDTALVKDGAAAIRTLGSSVDTTTKNLNPETTLGDIAYRSSTANVKTRLALGTANQQLRVNAGATAPEWFTPAAAASGLTKITSGTFSDVASVTVDSVFSSTYKNYMMVLNIYAATRTDDLHLQLRYGSTTHTASNHYTSAFRYDTSNTLTAYGAGATTQFTLSDRIGNSAESTALTIYFSKVGNSSEYPGLYGSATIDGAQGVANFAGWIEALQTYTGFLLKSSSSNISGRYQVYGLEN